MARNWWLLGLHFKVGRIAAGLHVETQLRLGVEARGDGFHQLVREFAGLAGRLLDFSADLLGGVNLDAIEAGFDVCRYGVERFERLQYKWQPCMVLREQQRRHGSIFAHRPGLPRL